MQPMDEIAATIRREFLQKSFGVVQLWGFAAVRPNDQMYELVSTHVDGTRLDLVLVHESRQGLASVISIWEPAGLHIDAQGLHITAAARVKMDETEAIRDGQQFHLKTSSGEGVWPCGPKPALRLAH